MKQCPDVAIERLLPEILACGEIPAHTCSVDPGVDRGAVKRQQTSLAVANYADGRPLAVLSKPIYRRQHLLHLIADDVASHLVGHAIDEFAVRQIGMDTQ